MILLMLCQQRHRGSEQWGGGKSEQRNKHGTEFCTAGQHFLQAAGGEHKQVDHRAGGPREGLPQPGNTGELEL